MKPGRTPQIGNILCYFHLTFSFEKMTHHTQLEDKLGGANKFWAWKYRISLVLEENDLDQFIYGDVLEPPQ